MLAGSYQQADEIFLNEIHFETNSLPFVDKFSSSCVVVAMYLEQNRFCLCIYYFAVEVVRVMGLIRTHVMSMKLHDQKQELAIHSIFYKG